MAINVKGLFLFSKYSIPHMQAGGKGVIINMFSVLVSCESCTPSGQSHLAWSARAVRRWGRRDAGPGQPRRLPHRVRSGSP